MWRIFSQISRVGTWKSHHKHMFIFQTSKLAGSHVSWRGKAYITYIFILYIYIYQSFRGKLPRLGDLGGRCPCRSPSVCMPPKPRTSTSCYGVASKNHAAKLRKIEVVKKRRRLQRSTENKRLWHMNYEFLLWLMTGHLHTLSSFPLVLQGRTLYTR